MRAFDEINVTFLSSAEDCMTTIADPRAAEMMFFRQNSMEAPPTPGSDPGQPLMNAQLQIR